jgi:hypothetical protein
MTPLALPLPPFLRSQGKAGECRLCLCASVETLRPKSTAQTSPQDHRQPVLSQSSQLWCATSRKLGRIRSGGQSDLRSYLVSV